MGAAIGFFGIVIAASIATALYILGTLASAQGQILKATLDTAVNSSEFLTPSDKARAMRLPYGAPGTAVVDLTARADWRCRCGQQNPAQTTACLDCGHQVGAA